MWLVALAVIANAFAFSGRASAPDRLPNTLAKKGFNEFAVRNGFRAVEGPFNFPNAFAFFCVGVVLMARVKT